MHALRVLPVVAFFAAPLAAQARARVAVDGEWFYQAAAGRRLAQLMAGGEVEQNAVQGDWAQVTIDGWIIGASVGPTDREGFDLEVSKGPAENLRAAPAGPVVARLIIGFALDKVGEQGRWVHVRRQGWVRRAALKPLGAAAPGAVARAPSVAVTPGKPAADTVAAPSPAPRSGATPPEPTAAPFDPTRAQSARTTPLYRAPDGASDATLAANAPLRVLGRTGEWSRVQLEGWVKTADLQTAPPGVLVGVSAAELRADPPRFIGQTLRWTLQVIALRTADDLRPDMPDGATYLLARGPLPERGFVYVVIPDGKRAVVQGLAPLATVQVTARVRTGRSRFVGYPVVDLVSLEEQP